MEKIKVIVHEVVGIYITYHLTHTKNNWVNKYKVQAKVGGIMDVSEDLYVICLYAECINENEHTNEETITDAFAVEKCEQYLMRNTQYGETIEI